ncbi:MAG: hypothetical protein JXA78_03710 [Anaerolineales bacterium]|nr:hypothetical protein [Anaerolineales bacterium]
MPGNVDESARQTAIAQNVQATVNAEDAATLQVRQTEIAAKETEVASQLEGTVIAQQATLQAEETALQQETQVANAPAATATQVEPSPAASFEPILILDWEQSCFIPMYSGCQVADTLCWKADDNYDKHYGGILSLVSEESIFIDPDWPSPYLAFWHQYDFQREASISVLSGDQWEYLKIYSKAKNSWIRELFDLSKYKGENLVIQFSLKGRLVNIGGIGKHSEPKSEWYIQEVLIIPDYSP